LVLLHGFTQTARLWGAFGDLLAADHTLVAIDLPGHGESSAVRADLLTTATLVHEAVTAAIGPAPCDLLGYSLGARVGLHVLLATSLALNNAVLISATAGIEDDGARESRRKADDAVADALEASGDVDGFIARWLRAPMFQRLGSDAQADERRRNGPEGLAWSLRLEGTGTQEPLWHRLPSVTVPVLALAGTDDTRFAAHALRMANLMPHGTASLIPGGGHAVHLAQPKVTWRLVHDWLTRSYKQEPDREKDTDSEL
jgi:2-succinyl-6-hydroxy-2,4-cyclohexadiene-1-carboxylate synthase